MSPRTTRGPSPEQEEVRELAKRLRQAREAQALSFQDLAEIVGASQQTIRRLERGSGLSGAVLLARIARALNAPVDALVNHARTDVEITDQLWEKLGMATKVAGSREADFKARRAILKALGLWRR